MKNDFSALHTCQESTNLPPICTKLLMVIPQFKNQGFTLYLLIYNYTKGMEMVIEVPVSWSE